ncbi:hypothetical protein [Pseudomonas brenneri]
MANFTFLALHFDTPLAFNREFFSDQCGVLSRTIKIVRYKNGLEQGLTELRTVEGPKKGKNRFSNASLTIATLTHLFRSKAGGRTAEMPDSQN